MEKNAKAFLQSGNTGNILQSGIHSGNALEHTMESESKEQNKGDLKAPLVPGYFLDELRKELLTEG